MTAGMVIFDDGRGRLGPMTDLRAAFEVRTGMMTTAGRIAATCPEPLAGFWVPARLEAVVAERAGARVNTLPDGGGEILCVNGRWALPQRLALSRGQAFVEEETGDVVAARLSRADAETLLASGLLPDGCDRVPAGAGVLYRHPWDVLARLPEALARDIEAAPLVDAQAPDRRAAVVGDHPVEIHRTATLYPNVVLDAGLGPVVVHERATIRPGAVVCGPCAIGRDAIVVDHALIKPNTVIGPVCKVGGEVGATIFQGYANKSHDGHLGDSWVGKWANFGASATNSNLLNTYGEIAARIDPEGPVHRTGMTFLGAIVGDHVKLAIGTRLMTGAVIGTGAMIATTAPPPAAVRAFAWLTDRGEQVFRFEKFLGTARRMMSRRDLAPTDAYVAALEALHAARTGKTGGGADLPPPA